MAADFYRSRNLSMIDLLKSSGYLQDPKGITEQDLESVLRLAPSLVQPWVILSLDKRTRYGWYILAPNSKTSEWTVGWYPRGPKYTFSDEFAACAAFIKREAEHLREMVTD
jgi:hypothetical protein